MEWYASYELHIVWLDDTMNAYESGHEKIIYDALEACFFVTLLYFGCEQKILWTFLSDILMLIICTVMWK